MSSVRFGFYPEPSVLEVVLFYCPAVVLKVVDLGQIVIQHILFLEIVVILFLDQIRTNCLHTGYLAEILFRQRIVINCVHSVRAIDLLLWVLRIGIKCTSTCSRSDRKVFRVDRTSRKSYLNCCLLNF